MARILDPISLRRIELLHPLLRADALAIYHECIDALRGAVTLRYTHTLRTFSEQNNLYAKGRTQPGSRVTWARGGRSFHNYGLAIDICLITKDFKSVSWDTLKDFDGDGISDWIECARIFEAHGWQWGGRWPKPKTDMPHFQKPLGYDIDTLLALHKAQNHPNYLELA